MARDTVASRMGANLKSSKGVAVGPDTISREPAAWARGATTAALLSCIFFLRFPFWGRRRRNFGEFFVRYQAAGIAR